MATDTAAEQDRQDIVQSDTGPHEAHHPTDAQYIKIAIILAVVTAVEVALYYWSIPGVNLNNAVLGILALVKFVMVAAYFMHLKFDHRILRRLFITGVILAFAVYIAYLLTLGVFIKN